MTQRILLFLGLFFLAQTAQSTDTRTLLERFVLDFASDPFARDMDFGFDVDGERWHMKVESVGDNLFKSSLIEGFPDHPILYWEFSKATLDRFTEGLNGETATARARAEDPVLLRTRATPDFPRYTLNAELSAFIEQLRLHFWTTGIPEEFVLDGSVSVVSHGANVVGLVYQQGLRTMWYQVMPGQHVNEDPADQANPFDSLVIMSRGQLDAVIDGKPLLMREHRAYIIPAGMTHEFINKGDVPAEGILIMYGDGA